MNQIIVSERFLKVRAAVIDNEFTEQHFQDPGQGPIIEAHKLSFKGVAIGIIDSLGSTETGHLKATSYIGLIRESTGQVTLYALLDHGAEGAVLADQRTMQDFESLELLLECR